MAPPTVHQLAAQWLALDRDPSTRREIQTLLDANDEPALEARMRPRIAFGTAGLRARMQAGFARMNGLTVAQATAGLAARLLDGSVPDAARRGVVVGHDHRHGSAAFADLAAGVLLAAGVRVRWLERVVHTPLVPFAIRRTGAAAGIMVTASHNPAHDNGYKVWWENACQIIPPVDSEIAASIDRLVGDAVWNPGARPGNELAEDVLDSVEGEYYAAVERLIAPETLASIEPVVYTPMHGVGRPYLVELVKRISDRADVESFLIPVPEQADPDPDFSTVRFPNPEEKGALDLAYRTADQHGVRSVIALDPDADRFSAAEKTPDGAWVQFTGNEVGMLLASYMLSQPQWSTPASRHRLAMLNTTVSTGMLRAMASAEGFRHAETLTGFKWLGNAAQTLEAAGQTVPLAFEEALGYMFPAVGHDKDGVAAAAVWLAARAHWAAAGRSPAAQLAALHARYGAFADANSYLLSPSAAVTAAVFAHIRRDGVPGRVGPHRIVAFRDLTTGVDTGAPGGVPALPVDAAAQMITCELDDGTRFTVRASGTEPKIKMYVESVADDVQAARAKARAVRREIVDDWFDLETWRLREPEE